MRFLGRLLLGIVYGTYRALFLAGSRSEGVVPDRKERMDELATALEELLAFTPASRTDVDRWYELARRLQDSLLQGGLGPEVPNLLWHYLFDADIRFKDRECAAMQDRQMRLLVRFLKRGEMPSEKELKKYS